MRARPERVAVCALVLALAACGGSSSATLSKEQYDSKMSRLCLVAADQIREVHYLTSVAALRAEGSRVVAIERRFNHKLASLKPPDSIRAAAAAYLRADERKVRDFEAAVAAAKARDRGKLQEALGQAITDTRATGPLAKKIGAAGCYIG